MRSADQIANTIACHLDNLAYPLKPGHSIDLFGTSLHMERDDARKIGCTASICIRLPVRPPFVAYATVIVDGREMSDPEAAGRAIYEALYM